MTSNGVCHGLESLTLASLELLESPGAYGTSRERFLVFVPSLSLQKFPFSKPVLIRKFYQPMPSVGTGILCQTPTGLMAQHRNATLSESLFLIQTPSSIFPAKQTNKKSLSFISYLKRYLPIRQLLPLCIPYPRDKKTKDKNL